MKKDKKVMEEVKELWFIFIWWTKQAKIFRKQLKNMEFSQNLPQVTYERWKVETVAIKTSGFALL